MPDGNENTTPATSPYVDTVVRKISESMTDEELRKIIREELVRNSEYAILEAQQTPEIISSLENFQQYLRDSLFINTDSKPWLDRFNQLKEEVITEISASLYFNALKGMDLYYRGGDVSAEQAQTLNVAEGADPVNLFNGNFSYSVTDFTINGAGIDFAFTRSYSQLSAVNSILGYKWDHAYNLWLRRSSDETLIFRANGALREIKYQRHAVHPYWFAEAGDDGIIMKRNNQLIRRSPDGTEFRYAENLSGRPDVLLIDRIEDRFGNYLQFGYQDALLTTAEVNSVSRMIFFHYDSENRLIKITDFTGRSWKYTYDDLGDLVAVTTPSTEDYPGGLTTWYEYSSYLFGSASQQHNLLRITDSSGQIYLENEYGTEPGLLSFNRIIRQRQGSGETYLEYADVVEDFSFPYGPHQLPACQTIETKRDGQQVRYLFNRYGNLIFREEYARINGVPRLISSHYRYNKDGNLVGTISPTGIIDQFLYGRDYYERIRQPDNDYRATEDPDLTGPVRQGFNRLLATVRRGRYYNQISLNLSQGLWSTDLFPDIFDVNDDDIIQKFSYEPDFGQPLSISDPRTTQSPDPEFAESPDYARHLTIFSYKALNGSSFYLLDRITGPEAVAPDGSSTGSSVLQFLNYDPRGRLLSFQNAGGLITEMEYDTDNLQEGMLKRTVTDPSGLNIREGVERDDLGRVIRVFEARFYEFQDGRFVSEAKLNELDQITAFKSTSPFDILTKRKYNRSGTLSQELQEVKDSNGIPAEDLFLKTSFKYDQEFRPVGTIQGDTADSVYRIRKVVFDRAGRPALTLSAAGRKTKTVYNERSLPAKEIMDYGGTGIHIRKYYDAEGRLIRVADQRGGMCRIQYNTSGKITQVVNPEGNVACSSYDKTGNKLTERFFEQVSDQEYVLQSRSEFQYDETGRMIRVGVNLFDHHDEVVHDPDRSYLDTGPGRLLVNRFFYDQGGRLIRTIDQSSREFAYEYDLLGRKVRQTDPYGNEVSYTYDRAGNLIRTDRMEMIRNTSGDITGKRFFATESKFDELNRITEITDPLGNKTTFRYDSRGLPEKTINPLGEELKNQYDVFGRLIKTTRFLASPVDPQQKIPVSTAYRYEMDDLLISQTDAPGRETLFQYNSFGKNVSTTLPDLSEDKKEYDLSGMLISRIDRNGLKNRYTRDVLGRVVRHETDLSGLDSNLVVEGTGPSVFSYDSLGRLVKAGNDHSVCEFGYNSLGWPIKETATARPFTGDLILRPLVTERFYNDNGAINKISYPDGRQIGYELDVLDRIINIQQLAKGDHFPGNPGLPQSYTIAAMEYEGLQRKAITRQNHASTQFKYDFGGRLAGLDHFQNGNGLMQMRFLYDGAGNMRQKTESGLHSRSDQVFDYDEMDRLTAVRADQASVIPDADHLTPPASRLPHPIPDKQSLIDGLIAQIPTVEREYDLDQAGNRIRLNEAGLGDVYYQTNDLDQYTAIENQSFQYDRNGNLIHDGKFQYRYNFRNQPTSVIRISSGETILSFAYDALGRKAVEHSNNAVRQFVCHAVNPLEEYENGILASSNVPDREVDELVQISTGGKELYLLADQVKSVRYVLNGEQVENFFSYDEYGIPHAQSPVARQYLYQGKTWYPDPGKYDYFTRFYDPVTGRFLQRDSKGYQDGTNLYLFLKDNPLTGTDPFGTESRKEIQPAGETKKEEAPPAESGKDEWKLFDNPIWNVTTNDGVGLFFTLLESANPAGGNFSSLTNVYRLGKMSKVRDLISQTGYVLDDLLRLPANKVPSLFSKGFSITGLGMSRINAFLAPLGIISNSMSIYDALFNSEKHVVERGADVTFSGAGLVSSMIGTSSLIGLGLKGIGATGAGNFLLHIATKAGPVGLLTGAAAGGYAIGTVLREKTGWGDASGELGASVTKKLLEYDSFLPDFIDTGGSYAIGFTVTVGGTIAEPFYYGGKKIYEGGSYVANKVDDFIESRDWGKTIRPWQWFD